MPPHVFIGASSKDYELAQQVYDFLTSHFIELFFSRESLPTLGSSDYRKQIDAALDQAMHMVVVTSSADNVKSPWLEAEWGFFVNEKRSGHKDGNLVTVIAGTMTPRDLPPSLRYYEVIPFAQLRQVLHYVGGPGRPIEFAATAIGASTESGPSSGSEARGEEAEESRQKTGNALEVATGIEASTAHRSSRDIATSDAVHTRRENNSGVVGDTRTHTADHPAPIARSVPTIKWTTMEWCVLGGGLIGLIVFLSLFGDVSLAPNNQAPFGRSRLPVVIRQNLESLGSVALDTPTVSVSVKPLLYQYVADRFGANAARLATSTEVPYWAWTGRQRDGTQLQMGPKGELLSFSRLSNRLGKPLPPVAESKAMAAQVVAARFKVPVATLELEREAIEGFANVFVWVNPNGSFGLTERYRVAFDAFGLAVLSRVFDLPSDYEITSNIYGLDQWGGIAAIGLAFILTGAGFFHRRQVVSAVRWRLVLTALAFVCGCGIGLLHLSIRVDSSGTALLVSIASGAWMAIVVFYGNCSGGYAFGRSEATR